jgi:hypothetical protein
MMQRIADPEINLNAAQQYPQAQAVFLRGVFTLHSAASTSCGSARRS